MIVRDVRLSATGNLTGGAAWRENSQRGDWRGWWETPTYVKQQLIKSSTTLMTHLGALLVILWVSTLIWYRDALPVAALVTAGLVFVYFGVAKGLGAVIDGVVTATKAGEAVAEGLQAVGYSFIDAATMVKQGNPEAVAQGIRWKWDEGVLGETVVRLALTPVSAAEWRATLEVADAREPAAY